MSILDRIKWFRKKKLDNDHDDQDDKLAIFALTVKDDLNVDLSILWNRQLESPKLAFILGSLIHELTNGLYSEKILQHLQNLPNQHPEINPDFIDKILSTWREHAYNIEEQINNTPIIPPTQTFAQNIVNPHN